MNKQNKQMRKQKRNSNRSFKTMLPVVVSQPINRMTFRFRATAAVNTTIYVRNIYNLLHVALTNVLSADIIGSYRINAISMYAIADGGAATEYNTIALTFMGGLFGRNQEFTAAGSTANPGTLRLFPPSNCAANYWHSVPQLGAISGNGEPLLQLSSLSAGVIIDLTIQFILCDGSFLIGPQLTVVGATAGTVYTNSLDNSTNAGAVGLNTLQPVARFFLLGFG